MGCFNLSCAFSGTLIIPSKEVVYLYLINRDIALQYAYLYMKKA